MAKEAFVVIIALFFVAAGGVLALEGVCIPVNPNTGAFECNACEGSEISPAWIDRYNRECPQSDEQQRLLSEYQDYIRCWNGCGDDGECALECNAQYEAISNQPFPASGGGYQQGTSGGDNQQTGSSVGPDTDLEDPDNEECIYPAQINCRQACAGKPSYPTFEFEACLTECDKENAENQAGYYQCTRNQVGGSNQAGGRTQSGWRIQIGGQGPISQAVYDDYRAMEITLDALTEKQFSGSIAEEADLSLIFDALRKLHGKIDDATNREAVDEVEYLDFIRIGFRDLLVRLRPAILNNIVRNLKVPASSGDDDPNAEILLLSLKAYKKNDPKLQPQLDDAKRNLVSLLELRDQLGALGEEIVSGLGSEEEKNKLREQQDRLFSRFQYEEEELQVLYGRIIFQSPHNIEANFALGQLYWDKGYYNIARVFYRRALYMANVEEAERMRAVMGGQGFRRSVLDEDIAEYADLIWPSESANPTEKLERELRNSNTAKRIRRELDEKVLNVPENYQEQFRNGEQLSRAMALSQRAKKAINAKLSETFSEFGDVLYYGHVPLPKEYNESYATSYHELPED